MSYEELYRKIDGLWHDSFKAPGYTALRSVVELHKPYDFTWGGEPYTACYCGEMYPCPTIKTIEKELS